MALLFLLTLSLSWALVAAESCFTSASIVGAVLGSVLLLLALQLVSYLLWRLYWRSRRGQHLVLVTDPEKGGEYAFDNPCFREGGPLSKAAAIDSKPEQKQNKWTSWGAIRNNLGGLHGEKRRALDDSFPTEPQVTQVSLRSHDFTGLGFNICGNMRDGIFVKDVLHRGPASESGLIFPGDRIHSIRISLRHMVFEDALTILSYASPYEVTLEVETGSAPPTAHSRPSSLLRRERAQEQEQADRIVHPFYRSQSIADLAQIGKSVQKRSLPHAIDAGRVSPSCNSVPVRTERSQLETSSAAVLNPTSSIVAKPDRAKSTASDSPSPSPAPAEQNAHNVLRQRSYTRERGIDVPDGFNPFMEVSNRTSCGSGFDEVDLGPPPPQPSQYISDDSETPHKMGVVAKDVKTKISKGFHNLLHSLDRKKSPGREEEPEPVPEPEPQLDDVGVIPTEIPEEVRLAALAARSNRKSLGALSIQVDTEVKPQPLYTSVSSNSPSASPVAHGQSGQSSKRKAKAPRPPAGPADSEALHSDTDSEAGSAPRPDSGSGTTIELTASHITIHHSPTLPEEENTRKAASLGDLSRIDSALPSVNLLERAMSLDLADGVPQSGKKRKAPPAPSADDDLLVPDLEDLCAGASRKEPRLDGGLSTFERRLKKSSDWGTLEEALDLGPGIAGSPNEQVFVLSTPAEPEVALKTDLGSSTFVGVFGKQLEQWDDQPFSFSAKTEPESLELDVADDKLEPLSIEIRHESPFFFSHRSVDECSQGGVHTSRVSVNPVSSRSPRSSPSSSPVPGPEVFSSTPLRPTRTLSSSEVPPSPLNVWTDVSASRATFVTTTQLNSLEDPELTLDFDPPSQSEAFVTAVDSVLEDHAESTPASPVHTTLPMPLNSPMSSLTYVTEIQVTPTPSESSTSTSFQNGLTLIESLGDGSCSSKSESSSTQEKDKSSQPQTPDRDPVSLTSPPLKTGKNVSVTAIQGSRIPVLRSSSLSPEDRDRAVSTRPVPVRPPVPARRSTDQSQTPRQPAASAVVRKVNGVQIISPDHSR